MTISGGEWDPASPEAIRALLTRRGAPVRCAAIGPLGEGDFYRRTG
ncbi:MAG TPA: hypothetical protein VF187_01400 [Gemmatimonadales bacterium]